MPPAKMLAFYAQHFPTTEVNYTFRRVPSVATLEKWSESTPADFTFSLKAPQSITHWAKLRDCADTTRHFIGVAGKLGHKLGPILFQLPPTFPKENSVLEEFLQMLHGEVRAAFEFRHDSWFNDETFEILRRRNAALCVADSDDLATPFLGTADFGYLRLRRKEYPARSLTRWAAQIETEGKRWKEAYIYFKHEETGTGPIFAEKMKTRLA